MGIAKKILGTIPTIQATALASENVKFVEKKKKKSEDFVKMGMKNIVGTKLIDIESDMIAELK